VLGGVSVPDCIRSATGLAARVSVPATADVAKRHR